MIGKYAVHTLILCDFYHESFLRSFETRQFFVKEPFFFSGQRSLDSQQFHRWLVPEKQQNPAEIWGWYPTTMGFPAKNDHFGEFWGYHHLRKHPYRPKKA